MLYKIVLFHGANRWWIWGLSAVTIYPTHQIRLHLIIPHPFPNLQRSLKREKFSNFEVIAEAASEWPKFRFIFERKQCAKCDKRRGGGVIHTHTHRFHDSKSGHNFFSTSSDMAVGQQLVIRCPDYLHGKTK